MSLRHASCSLRIATLWMIVWLAAPADLHPAHAQEDQVASAVKVTYLYKFAPFIEWPTSAAEFSDGRFTICVVGSDALGAMLDRAVHGQDIAGHPIVVRRYADVTGNPGCAVMYVTGANAQVAAVLAAVRGLPVLTVTDGTAESPNGAPPVRSIINFVISDGHVRFEIDKGAATENELTVSSKLLNLAVRVLDRR
jgi:hypothetical protein